MSAPAFVWALERGAALKLHPSDRLVLIYLSDMANGNLICWPGQPLIERFTGLKNNTVREAIRRLTDAQLIRVETAPGKVTRYHILRSPTPANGTGVEVPNPRKLDGGAPSKRQGITPANGAGAPPQIGSPTPANGTGDPLSRPKKEERTPPVVPPVPGGKRGMLLPSTWVPSEKSFALGELLGLSRSDVLAEADGMRDWAAHRGEIGKAWDSRFDNWLRKEAKDRRLRHVRTSKPTLAEEWGLTSFLTPNFDDDETPPSRRLLS